MPLLLQLVLLLLAFGDVAHDLREAQQLSVRSRKATIVPSI
jgi:hypothetical protein